MKENKIRPVSIDSLNKQGYEYYEFDISGEEADPEMARLSKKFNIDIGDGEQNYIWYKQKGDPVYASDEIDKGAEVWLLESFTAPPQDAYLPYVGKEVMLRDIENPETLIPVTLIGVSGMGQVTIMMDGHQVDFPEDRIVLPGGFMRKDYFGKQADAEERALRGESTRRRVREDAGISDGIYEVTKGFDFLGRRDIEVSEGTQLTIDNQTVMLRTGAPGNWEFTNIGVLRGSFASENTDSIKNNTKRVSDTLGQRKNSMNKEKTFTLPKSIKVSDAPALIKELEDVVKKNKVKEGQSFNARPTPFNDLSEEEKNLECHSAPPEFEKMIGKKAFQVDRTSKPQLEWYQGEDGDGKQILQAYENKQKNPYGMIEFD